MIHGQQYSAGLGVSTVLASMDFETYSEAGYYWAPERMRWISAKKGKPGIKAVGAWPYTEHPSAEVLCLAYDLKGGLGCQLWRPGMSPPLDLFAHIACGNLIEAHNSFFEYAVWTNICIPKLHWPPLPLEQLVDAAAKCGAWTLPRKLENVAAALNTPIQKDKEGSAIMHKLSKPRNPTKADGRLRYTREQEPGEFTRLENYCVTDVAAEDSVSARCPDLSPDERRYFLMDQRTNARGVACDREGVNACMSIIAQAQDRYHSELAQLTQGAVDTSDKLEAIKKWALGRGIVIASMDKDNLPLILKRTDLPPDVRRVVEIRELMNSKSVTKTRAMSLEMCSDDRLRGLYTFCGAARTWRWSGLGAQPQNLPNAGPKVVSCNHCAQVRWEGLWFCPSCFRYESKPCDWGIEAAEACLADVMTRSIDHVEMKWGDALLAIAGCLRSLFIAGPGRELISSDYNSIEAIVLPWLAGERWRQEVFLTHGKIYEMSASQISGTPFAEFKRYQREHGRKHPLRHMGKIGELSSQFGGWVEAWKRFGAAEFLSDEEIEANCKAWRAASPAIVNFWWALENAAMAAIEMPGSVQQVQPLKEYQAPVPISYQMHEGVLYCHLPSGRPIAYHSPVIDTVLRYEKPKRQIRYKTTESGMWIWAHTRGPKLCENIVQALARDAMAPALCRLEDAGYLPVLHTHDEPVTEVPLGWGSIEEIEALMAPRETWCEGWPIKAEGGWRGLRYRKDN